jgi:ankyrin repeat protein
VRQRSYSPTQGNLLTVYSRSSTTQVELLRLKENRRIIQKVADDTRTIRDSMSAANSQAGFTTGSNRQSIVGSMVFDFDSGFAATAPYQAVMTGALSAPNAEEKTRRPQHVRRKPIEQRSTNNDEGYHSMDTSRAATPTTVVTRNQSISSINELNRSLSQFNLGTDARDVLRSQSVHSIKSSASRPDPAIRRWLSLSSSSLPVSPSHVDKFSDLRKKNKLWSALRRLNTSSTANLKGNAKSVQSISPTAARHRGMRGQETNLNQSIDFGTVSGLDAPALVRAAQAGSRIEVERMIDQGYNIEAAHGPTGRTALAVAAHCGNAEVVKTLIQLNAEVNPRDHTLATPLHLAASRGHIGVLELLLNEGVQLEETDDKKSTALWTAVERGRLEAVELLLQKGAKVNTRAESQLTPLHIAAYRGDVEMVELLLSHAAQIEARDSQFMAALHYACEKGHQAVVDALLNKGASIEALGADGKSPLICAAAEGHRHVVEFLLKKKASIRSKDERHYNAVHWAAYHGHVEVTDLLLQKKLPINEITAEGWTPLHLAVIGSHFSAVEFLLRMNATLELQCQQGLTPLHYACGSDSSDIVRLLLGAGAQAEAKVAGDLRRPIHIAASTGNADIVKLLCEKLVAIDNRDSAGDRPLCLAAYHGHAAVVSTLLDFHSPLRLPFGDRTYEDSPLCVAAKEGNLEVVSVLLSRGASVRQKDEHGWPPIRYAAHHGHPEILELLLTQASILSSDDAAGTLGFDHIAESVGFNAASNISDERKRRVRELLSQAEDQANAYMAERTMRAPTPLYPTLTRTQRAELDPDHNAYNPQEMAANMTNSGIFRSRTVAAPPPQTVETQSPRFQAHSSIDPSVSRPNSNSPLSNYIPTPPISDYQPPSRLNSTFYRSPSSRISSISPEEAALLIENRRNEIAQLQQLLPSIDETSGYGVKEFYAPVAPTVYHELCSY